VSEPNNLLRIDDLRLQNFRCFAACELNLHPTLTVLVAENAQGKTALLDALRLALQEFVNTVGRRKQPHGFDRTDIHLRRSNQDVMESRLPTEFRVGGEVDGEPVSWRHVLSKDTLHARTSTKDAKDIRRIAKRLADQPDVNDILPTDPPTVLPVVSYYGTGRLYDEHRLTEGKRRLSESSPIRASAYLDCLSPSSSYKSFSAWFGQKWEQASDPRFRAVGFEARPENQLAAVREAVHAVLEPTGWAALSWQKLREDDWGHVYGAGHIALEHPEKGRFPLNYLSDGVRNMAALAGDLAHRCVRLNPHLGEAAAKRTPGVVLIDEVDMHLHPRWQQLVVGLLRSTFPNVQFVVTTHSPHVLTSIRKEHIRIIAINEDGKWSTQIPQYSPLGQESSDALAFVMGAHPRPQLPILDDVQIFEQMARAGKADSEDAQAVLERLNQAGFEFTDAQKALFSVLAKKSQSQTPESHG
jgi:predicted ATP-binding protein involved in virulence